MTVREKYLQSKKSEEEKLLKKYEVIDSYGRFNSEGWELLKEILFEQHKEAILKTLRDLEDAENKTEEEPNGDDVVPF